MLKVCLALKTLLDRDRLARAWTTPSRERKLFLGETLPGQLAQGKKKIEGIDIKAPCDRFNPTGFTHLSEDAP
ncbi:MAG: hypothetical protein V2J65_36975 [Desulfobacteraceae bacterium]|nr:hypothetical protein [Desulfobacteraceae bacterium]